MSNPLEKEFEYFLANQKELVEKYRGKFVVIRDQKVIGVFDDELKAVEDTQKQFPLGTFLVQKCEPESYKQTFHSRVVFQ